MKKLLFLLLLLFLAGCSKGESEEESKDKPYTLDPVDGDVIIVYADGYEAEVFIDLTEEINLRGLLCRTDDILAVDTAGNRILQFNYEGELIGSIGTTGNGKGEFLNPLWLTACDEKLYVLDSGNMRVVVLNPDLSVEKEISLQGFGIHGFGRTFSSLAVLNEDMIFITMEDFDNNKAFLLKNQKELMILEEKFEGICAAGNGKVYFAQSMVDGKTGKVFYAEYDEEKGLIKNQLPYFNSPYDLIISGEDMYVLNGVYGAVERCALNGDYKETIYKFLRTIEDRIYLLRFSMDADGNFYVYDDYNHVIQKVYKTK